MAKDSPPGSDLRAVLMVSTNPIALKADRRPIRLLSFLIRTVWAVIVFALVCALWLVLFVVFAPFLILSELFGWRSRFQVSGAGAEARVPKETAECRSDSEMIFDRRQDVSKLFGCNTRGVYYRWNLFADRLENLKSRVNEPNALDFGAGSLRDSYELSKSGFRVVSVDLDEAILSRYSDSYHWNSQSSPTLFTGPLENLARQTGPDFFHLAIAFDVIEHLEDPANYCRQISSLLHEQGMLFTIVPNRRSIFERYFRYTLKKQREKGVFLRPGVPHLQFKTPAEWEELFESNGFRILEHEMAIGFFVNDCWNGLLSVPIKLWITPVLTTLAHFSPMGFTGDTLERAMCPPWLMARVHVLDLLCKKWLGPGFGWNLIVAQKKTDRTVQN
jgi:2-polyprenyl-3-methyl-5-hydroxy-6-metoxy-1,4-benzoquinol methylase